MHCCDRDIAESHLGGPNPPGPIRFGVGIEDVLVQAVGDRIEQVILAVDMVVERHRLNPKLGAQLAHAQLIEAALVDQRQRCLGDQCPIKGRTLGDRHPESVGRAGFRLRAAAAGSTS